MLENPDTFDFQVALLLVGALISLISSVIGYSAHQLLQATHNKTKKVKLYKKIIYSTAFQNKTWGFQQSSNGLLFSVPMRIEIHNTKNTVEIIRNLSLILYNNNKKIGRMVQIEKSGNTENEIYFGNDGKYSFLIQPQTIERYTLQFIIKHTDLNSNFDEVRIQYYNTKDKKREYHLLDIHNCWIVQQNTSDKDWELLK